MIDVADGEQVLAYLRLGEKPSDNILVLLNYGTSPAHVAIDPKLAEMLNATKLTDLLSGNDLNVEASKITIAGESVRILKPQSLD